MGQTDRILLWCSSKAFGITVLPQGTRKRSNKGRSVIMKKIPPSHTGKNDEVIALIGGYTEDVQVTIFSDVEIYSPSGECKKKVRRPAHLGMPNSNNFAFFLKQTCWTRIACKVDCTQECHLFISMKHPHHTYPLYETTSHLIVFHT